MNGDFSSIISPILLIVMLMIVISMTMLLFFNSMIRGYLKQHNIANDAFTTTIAILLWGIGSVFFVWWISGLLAAFLSYLIYKVAKI